MSQRKTKIDEHGNSVEVEYITKEEYENIKSDINEALTKYTTLTPDDNTTKTTIQELFRKAEQHFETEPSFLALNSQEVTELTLITNWVATVKKHEFIKEKTMAYFSQKTKVENLLNAISE